jgi:RNA polymerase sigma factor (sigma-70 family)
MTEGRRHNLNPDPAPGPGFEQYLPALHRFLVRRLRSTQDARDLAQEVYLRLLRVADPKLVRQPLPYMYRIASNVAYEFRIHQQQDTVTFDTEAMEQLSEHPSTIQPDELSDRISLERQIAAVLNELPPLQRAVLLMQKRDGMSYEEIAGRLSISVHTVEKYLFRALAVVRATRWER